MSPTGKPSSRSMTPVPSFDEFLARLRAEPDPAPPAHYGPYRSYRRLWQAVAELRAHGPTPLDIECYGRSAGGEPLWVVHLGQLDKRRHPRARVLYLANLHAQEFIGVEAALATLRRATHLLAAADPALDGAALSFVLTANPDGYRRVARELAAGTPRFRRKNLHGVDLNRNFAEGHAPGALPARLLPFLFHPGSAPLSEPETAALDALAARRYHRALSFHSFGGYIFWPWATRRRPTYDDVRFAAIAQAMRRAMPHPYAAAQLGRWSSLFRAGGLEIDHLYRRHGTLAFLIEVSHGGRQFGRPSTWLDPFSWFNPVDVAAEVDNVVPAALTLCDPRWDE